MQNSTLILAAIASLGAGVLGGLAANPVMLPRTDLDWRAKYRTDGNRSTQPAPDYIDGGSAMYPYAMAGLARRAEVAARTYAAADAELVLPADRPLPDDPWGREVLRQPAQGLDPAPPPPAEAEEPRDNGSEAVAGALALTSEMFPQPPDRTDEQSVEGPQDEPDRFGN